MRIDGCGTLLLMGSNMTELVLTFWLENADNSLFLYFFSYNLNAYDAYMKCKYLNIAYKNILILTWQIEISY